MEKVDITIIGAGVVGLAVASKLSTNKNTEIVLLERHNSFGKETSSRNSEVIHAGMYYPTDSLKAKLCVEGNRKLYELCKKNSIPQKKIGKLIIANNEKESEKIHSLYTLGNANGVPNLSLLTKEQIQKKEPCITAKSALLSPETGIIDTHQLMNYYEKTAESNGVIIAYNCNVQYIEYNTDKYTISVLDADNQIVTIQSNIVINCAGLHSDTIATMAGIDIHKENCKIYPCKGEYFNLSNKHKNKLNHLVYPAPTQISLGIHTVLDLNNSVKLGPNAFYIDSKDDYNVDSSHQREFFDSVRTYLPFIEFNDLSPAMSGIRPKLQSPKESFRDFIIREESDNGLPGFINLLGVESPGITASAAIGEYVFSIINGL